MKYLSLPFETTMDLETSLPVPAVVGMRIFFSAGFLTTCFSTISKGFCSLVATMEVSFAMSIGLPPPRPTTRSYFFPHTIS